jgi:hypothetical protein
MDKLLRILTYPQPLRALIFRRLISRLRIGSYPIRLRLGAVDRVPYGWCLYHSAVEAKALGHTAITAVELGVAGGRGLLCLCANAEEVTRATGVDIKIYGMDTGKGLPKTGDFRDLLYCWPPDSFKMDLAKLRELIGSRADVLIGDVREKINEFTALERAPLGAVMFDLDLYTSTVAALRILQSPNRLPRVWCYFDDVVGYPENAFCEKTGERAAINEYNLAGGCLSPANCFRNLPVELWHSQVYVEHQFNHPDYDRYLSPTHHELPLP